MTSLDRNMFVGSGSDSKAKPDASLTEAADDTPSISYCALGRRLGRLRRMLGLSQGAAASTVEVTRTQWMTYEAGSRRIPYEAAIRLAGMARVTADWIYRGDATGISHAVLNNIGSGASKPLSPATERHAHSSENLRRDTPLPLRAELLSVRSADSGCDSPAEVASRVRRHLGIEDLSSDLERIGM